MINSLVLKNILQSCNKLIFSEPFKMAYRIGNAFSRSRKLSFSNAIYFILGSSKKALSSNLADFRDSNPFLSFPSISRQAFSKARGGIHFEAFRELLRHSVSSFYSFPNRIKTWNDFLVLAVDGTSLQLPDTLENRNTFGFIKNQHSPGRAICSASALYDVLNDIIVDGLVARYGTSERSLALMHLESLDCINSDIPTIITFDRGYPSQAIFHALDRRGIKFVIRAAGSFKISNKIQLPDSLISNTFQNRTMALRCINFVLSSGSHEQLLTNLLDPTFSISDFSQLYFLRWGVEVKYKELKGRLQIEEFTGNRPIAIKQDFYTTLFLSNLVAIAKEMTDSCIQKELQLSCSQKHYQANRSFLISRMKYFLIRLLVCTKRRDFLIKEILNEAKKCVHKLSPTGLVNAKPISFRKNTIKI